MNHGIVSQQQLIDIESALQQELIANGVLCALLVDTAGNTVAEQNDGKSQYDTYAFAALAAGNYATVDSMAKLVGETDFAQLYHKGEKVSIHFSKMSEELLAHYDIRQRSCSWLLRLQVGELREKLRKICDSPPTRFMSNSVIVAVPCFIYLPQAIHQNFHKSANRLQFPCFLIRNCGKGKGSVFFSSKFR